MRTEKLMGSSNPTVPGPATDPDAEPDAVDFATRLLTCLTAMAARSSRRQAELATALHCAGLTTDPPRVRAALRRLEAEGCISNLVPLSDGGLLLTTTGQVLGWKDVVSPWLIDDHAAREPGSGQGG
jgi:hypothetical protein